MSEKSMIIIGGGLAGLATGCYGQMNGYRTRIFEKLSRSGGVCTSWKRRGYTFDYALHNLFGIRPDRADNRMWRELGALRGLETFSFEEFSRIEADGKALTVYTDLDRLEKHMLELAPGDRKKIREFVGAIRRISGHDMFAALSGGLGTKLRMLPLLRTLMKYSKMTLDDLAAGFSDPFLRKAIPSIQYDLPGIPAIIPMIFLAEMSRGDGGWPVGGSAALSRNVEKRYLELGGQISYRSSVAKILVEGDRAVGVELADGTKHRADVIVSAADGHSTIFGMLGGRYTTDLIDSYYKSYPGTVYFGLEVWYGVKRNLAGEPHALVLAQEKPLEVEGLARDRLDVEIFNFDPTLAPPGKSVVKVVMESNYDYWKKLSKDYRAYARKKRRIADAVAKRLDRRFPRISSQVEAVDVITPVSVERFTASCRGSLPWPAPQAIAQQVLRGGISKALPGLRDFYMVGQWAGGVYSTTQVSAMGRDLVRRLCKQDGKKFVATVAD